MMDLKLFHCHGQTNSPKLAVVAFENGKLVFVQVEKEPTKKLFEYICLSKDEDATLTSICLMNNEMLLYIATSNGSIKSYAIEINDERMELSLKLKNSVLPSFGVSKVQSSNDEMYLIVAFWNSR